MTEQQATGWYPDPSDPNSEIYWNGTQWHGRREKFIEPATRPTAPEPPISQPSTGTPPSRPVTTIGAKQLSDNTFRIVALVGLALMVLYIGAECSRSNNAPDRSSQSTYATTTTTRATTTTVPASPVTETTPADQTDSAVAATATEWLANYFRAGDGQLKNTRCWIDNETDCWIKHVTKIDMYDKDIGFGAKLRTLRLHMDDTLDPPETRQYGQEGADWMYRAVKQSQGTGTPSTVAVSVEYVDAVTANGTYIASGHLERN